MNVEPHPGGGRHRSEDGPSASAPHRVSIPLNVHRWDTITFLHWAFEPEAVARLVPVGLDVLTRDGLAWVSVTPFVMRVRPPGVPVVPPGCTFPETNVRTYVAGPDGRAGLWFLHMEVGSRWFAAALRAVGLPYVHHDMSVHTAEGTIAYRSQARPPEGGGHAIAVTPGDLLEPSTGGPLDRFLTARWGAYHRRGPLLLYTPVEHPPWPLHRASLQACDVPGLFGRAGLPTPTEPPLVHHSPGVTVRVGPPRVVFPSRDRADATR